MPTPKTDRRVQRTQQLLQEALITLILEKGYDAITVQDILDRANLGRSTFYAHYRDKEDLLLSGFQELFAGFQKEYLHVTPPGGDPAQAGRNMSLFFFRHARTHLDLFKAMIGEQGGKIILEHTQQYLTQFIREHLVAQLSDRQKNLPVDLLAHYITSSYLALLTWWLNHDLPYSPEQMDAFCQQLLFPGIQAMLSATDHPAQATGSGSARQTAS
jgi:AcrR family transcriptional regulator